ncbi:hypothetical protein RA263_29905, partial [Pseudomonas syringae pv. tagetis]|uniref:hypothetical protein n=1 Tax=Pseudomonas syringae group genomosp. 7 TaxID=251699 RepID=UPI0037700BBA
AALVVKIGLLFQGVLLLCAWALKTRPTASGMRMSVLSLGLKGILLEGYGRWEGTRGGSKSSFIVRLAGMNLADVLKA